jgi:hypothetical protein
MYLNNYCRKGAKEVQSSGNLPIFRSNLLLILSEQVTLIL